MICVKLLIVIKSMYVKSLACVRLSGGESECFRIDSSVRRRCVMSPWAFNVYMDAVMKKMKLEMERMGVRFLGERKEWRLPGLLYAMTWFCVAQCSGKTWVC